MCRGKNILRISMRPSCCIGTIPVLCGRWATVLPRQICKNSDHFFNMALSGAVRDGAFELNKLLIGGLTLAALGAGSAVAADIPTKAPPRAVTATYDSGFYVWVDGSYQSVRLP